MIAVDRYLSNDVVSIQRDILDHVEYTVARNYFVFDDFKAYQVDSFKFLTLHVIVLISVSYEI